MRLRNIIYSIKVAKNIIDGAVWSEMRIQCMMMLFLNYTFSVCCNDLIATAANRNDIELKVAGDEDHLDAIWKGSADLKCSHRDSTDFEESIATLEMKVPFNVSGSKLFKSNALQQQQLLGQAMGVKQEHERPSDLSFLTDIVAISVMYRCGNEYYLSERVTDAKGYCLRLLLLCCGDLSSAEWSNLISDDTVAVDLSDEDDVDHHFTQDSSDHKLEADRSATKAATGPVTRSKAKGAGDGASGNRIHDVKCGFFGFGEDAHYRRLAEMTAMLRWEAKCLGHQYLGFEEIQQHNSLIS